MIAKRLPKDTPYINNIPFLRLASLATFSSIQPFTLLAAPRYARHRLNYFTAKSLKSPTAKMLPVPDWCLKWCEMQGVSKGPLR